MYKVESITTKRTGTTTQGKPYTIRSVKFEGNDESYDTFDELEVGQSYEGEIIANPNPKYGSSFKLKKSRVGGNFASKTQDINKAIEKKATNIQVAQERKNENINESANWRDAVMIVNTLLDKKLLVNGIDLLEPAELEKIIKSKIIDWKTWFEDKKNPVSEPPF